MSPKSEKFLRINLVSASLTATPAGLLQLPTTAVSLHGCPQVYVRSVETKAEVVTEVRKELAERLEQTLKDAYFWPTGPIPSGGAVLDQSRPVTLTAPLVSVGALEVPVSVTVTVTITFTMPPQNKWFAQADIFHRESERAHWSLQPESAPARAVNAPYIEVVPAMLSLRDGGAPAVLTAIIRNGSPHTPPVLAMQQLPTDLPDLNRELERLMNIPMEGPKSDGPGLERWQTTLTLNLSPAARDQLKGRTAFEPLTLACQVVVGTTATKSDVLLRVLPFATEFPGLIAIDLGTSSSTVTLYDPSVAPNTRGVPPEQEGRLAALLRTHLMDEEGQCRLAGVTAADWQELLENLDLPGQGSPAARLLATFEAGGDQLLEALRQLETHMSGLSIEEALRALLQQAYEEALLEPRFNSQRLIWVSLDEARRDERDIPSELEIRKIGTPVQVEMGREVHAHRQQALAGLATGNGGLTLGEINFKFHPSPKRYLGKDETLVGRLDGNQVTITLRQLVQSALQRLTELANAWRQRNWKESAQHRVSQGPFTRVVVTYPTVSPPAVRREIEDLVKSLGFQSVVTDYDEAVSAALFYFHRELGGSVDLGPELFKACAQGSTNGPWFQNALVLDIGGGSTDVALLSLKLEEDLTVHDERNRGAGGRYYVVTPKLLGSSGNRHLGGDLITLRVFELLKAAVADRVLVAAQTPGELTAEVSSANLPDGLLSKIRGMPEHYLEGVENGQVRFRAGSIFTPVANRSELDSLRRDALEQAEKILPTRWMHQTQRSSAFHVLWSRAESAKVDSLASGQPFRLDHEGLQDLLNEFGLNVKLAASVKVELTQAHFERAAGEIIQEAVRIARGLLLDRLPRPSPKENQEGLDWLILSGKTCNLELVRRVLERELEQPPAIRWSPDHVTFVPEYAKLATSAGACYAEKIRRLNFRGKQAADILEGGRNQLRFNINNLFWFLPCSFLLEMAEGELVIFKAGDPLHQLDNSELGKARSRVLGSLLLTNVLRRDFVGAAPLPWHTVDVQEKAEKIGQAPEGFAAKMQMQFEVDHRLLMKLYLWEGHGGDLPHHYVLDEQAPALKLPVPQGGGSPTAAWCDVAVAVEEALQANGDPEVLIRAGDPFRETFHVGDRQVRGLIGWREVRGQEKERRLPDFFRERRMAVYRRMPGEKDWQRLEGDLGQPGSEAGAEFPAWYQLTLDADGTLRAHRGMVRYWSTEDPEEWRANTERVLECKLGLVVAPPPPAHDPFDGSH